MAEFRLTPAALRDLEGIWQYTVERWGVEQAEHYVDLLNAAFEGLAQAPRSAPACDHIRPGYRRQSVERHVVYYRIEGKSVTVVRVLHDRMDAVRHL
jgi:toxin ParE1/3/4